MSQRLELQISGLPLLIVPLRISLLGLVEDAVARRDEAGDVEQVKLSFDGGANRLVAVVGGRCYGDCRIGGVDSVGGFHLSTLVQRNMYSRTRGTLF